MHETTIKVFRPWLKAKVAKNLNFVNIQEEGDDQRRTYSNRKGLEIVLFNNNNSSYSSVSLPEYWAKLDKTFPLE